MYSLSVIVSDPISKKSLFVVIISEKQEDKMVQLFGQFWWSLERQNPDYYENKKQDLN